MRFTIAPQRVVRAGVAGEDQARRAAVEVIADRRHGVARRQRRDAAPAEAHGRADRRSPGSAGTAPRRVGISREVGPDRPVEQVVAQDLDGRARRVHRERLRAHAADGVDQERDGRHVVQVRMRDEDVVDLRQLRERQVADAGAGVDQDVAVDAGTRWCADAGRRCRRSNRARAGAWRRPYFSSNTVTGSQSAVIGVLRARVTCSAYTRYSMQPGASRCKLSRLTSARSQLRDR